MKIDLSPWPTVARGVPLAGSAMSTSSRVISRSDWWPSSAQARRVGSAQLRLVLIVPGDRRLRRGALVLPLRSMSNQTRISPAMVAGRPTS